MFDEDDRSCAPQRSWARPAWSAAPCRTTSSRSTPRRTPPPRSPNSLRRAAPAAASRRRGPGDATAELTQLAQLHCQGILTDEEFSAKKAQLLGI